ncbi:MAG: FAD binding domain-containing protein [Planctomycetes bacterium]|nr:FAD binding domain-containing protein [Planctomycetota bacterium]
MKAFEYVRATSVASATEHLGSTAEERRVAKAGGIDILDLAKEGIVSPSRLVDLSRIEDLGAVDFDRSGTTLGAGLTLARLATDERIRREYPALAQAAAEAATPQIRSRATLGGNLCQRPRCWYFRNEHLPCLKKGGSACPALEGENQYHAIFGVRPCPMVHPSNLAVALLALGTTVHVHGKQGSRHVPIEEFFISPETDVLRETCLAPDEIVTSIRLAAPEGTSAYGEIREKQSFDWPLVSCAVAGTPGGEIRIALGAVAPVPRRATEAEAAVKGTRITPELAAKAAEAAFAAATPLSKNGHKVKVGKALVTDLLVKIGG